MKVRLLIIKFTTWHKRSLHSISMSWLVQAEGLACADPGVRTPIGLSGLVWVYCFSLQIFPAQRLMTSTFDHIWSLTQVGCYKMSDWTGLIPKYDNENGIFAIIGNFIIFLEIYLLKLTNYERLLDMITEMQ